MNPFKIIVSWLIILFALGIIVIPILFATTVGGEQRPLTFLAYLILAAKYGVFILSIVTPFFYFDWFKKYWYVILCFMFISGYYVILDKIESPKIDYSYREKTDYIGNDKVKSLKKYYSLDPEVIQSESYWRNGKRDSVWKIYSKDGSVLSKERFQNDTLVK